MSSVCACHEPSPLRGILRFGRWTLCGGGPFDHTSSQSAMPSARPRPTKTLTETNSIMMTKKAASFTRCSLHPLGTSLNGYCSIRVGPQEFADSSPIHHRNSLIFGLAGQILGTKIDSFAGLSSRLASTQSKASRACFRRNAAS